METFYTLMTLATLRLQGIRNEERGQGTLEYVGMIIVAAILAVAVLTAAKGVDLGGIFTTAVQKVTNQGG